MRKSALRSRRTRDCASCAARGLTLCVHGKGPERRSTLKPGGPIRPNRKKRAENFRQNYHSREFVRWVHGFPCAICGEYGWTEAAHVKRRSQGGKVEDNVVPLCGRRAGVTGCHVRFDMYELEDHRMRLATLAKELWRRWIETEGRHA